MISKILRYASIAGVVAALVSGCTEQVGEKPQPVAPAAAPPAKIDEHAHKPGSHGGTIVEIGRDNYHAEAVFEKGGLVRLFTLGQDETRVRAVESQELKAYAKTEGGTESQEFVLRPEPQPGDGPGTTSVFVGQLPAELVAKQIQVTVPSITIAGERFRFAFASTSHEPDMPPAAAPDDEQKMYLTPAGKYTADDIKANGSMTASAKYKGFKAAHDLKPRRGDLICPITLTKANPECTWVVNGHTYQFCCPPCIDEFVSLAREQPDQIRPPQAYRKK
jgi:hypothetical protein